MQAFAGHVRKRQYKRDGRVWSRFIATIEIGDDAVGDRERREKSFERERDAKAWIPQQGRLLELGVRPKGQSPTVGVLLDEWLAHGVASRGWSPSHYRRSLIVVRRDLAPLRRIPADVSSVRQVEALLDEKRATGAAPNTVRLIRAALSAALNLAVRRGALPRNVAALAYGAKVAPHAPRYLQPEQLATFRAAIDGDRLGPLYRLAMRLALRPSEALGLRWVDIDFESRTLTIAQNVQRFDRFEGFPGGYAVLDPRPLRVGARFPLSDDLVELLREQRVAQLEERVGASHWEDSGLVFTNLRGTALNGSYVNSHLKRLLALAGLPVITFQELRHTGATAMLALGAELAAIQELLGHTTIHMTRRYAGVVEPLKRDAVERVARFEVDSETVIKRLGDP